MRKLSKKIVLALGIIGTLFTLLSFILNLFEVSSLANYFLFIGIPLLFSFFLGSSFVFTKRNWKYILSRTLSALASAVGFYFILKDQHQLSLGRGILIINSALLFYCICDLIYKSIKLPQMFLLIPMIIFYIISLTSANSNATLFYVCGLVLVVLFSIKLLAKNRTLYEEETLAKE